MIRKVKERFSSVRMQLVASVFVVVAPALLITYIVNQDWFWRFAPEWMKPYATDVPWASFTIGLLALIAAWFGGEHFILRQVRALLSAAHRLAKGDLNARTGLKESEGELGQLARTFDLMAEALQQRGKEREETEKILLTRALQQTVVAALGQFALTNSDLDALENQAVILVGQTLEAEYCGLWERLPDDQLLLKAGTGWKRETVGQTKISGDSHSQIGFTLNSGEPVIATGPDDEKKFSAPPFFTEHGVVSSVTIAIPTREKSFGVLGVHTTRQRKFTSDEVQFLLAAATAIGMAAERKRADAEVQKLAAFAQLNPNPAMEFNANGSILYFNEAVLKLALSVNQNHPSKILPLNIGEIVRHCLETGRSKVRMETKMGGCTFSWSFHPMQASKVVHCYIEDTTGRLNLEAQLRQSQKMESVGQLAAGVAHDFNNMLTIIQGHSSSLLAKPTMPEEVSDPVQAIYFAAERAAGLTRQLLMFSRKNVMQLKPLDLRETVGNMTKMLQRLIGENISLRFNPPGELPIIVGDTGMMEQVLMNLSVNARDAMPQGGALTIELKDTHVDENYIQSHPEAHVGRCIRLRVADTGCGMDAKTLMHIFEPFFTTKEVGKGTGLGLATVYGIVKQHDGWLEVGSEPGKGTTFDVFFPAGDEMAVFSEKSIVPATPVAGGTETILVVEDEPVLREMARDILEEYGYKILEASSGKDALALWQRRNCQINLLLTDMVMPEGVSGVDLAEQLLAKQPQLKIIFTSGYTANEVSSEVLARTRARFLQKPYSHDELAKIVRECLDKNVTASVAVPA
jgi:nitrogen-specific signal transduction histidine kinase/ActR/RegA family two-component response regulator/HAMP domain-containing protein